MERDELIGFLKENLKVVLDNDYYGCGDFQVKLVLDGEVISEDYVSIRGVLREREEW